MIDDQRLARLSRLGRLLDEAVDIADACEENLLGAQIAQALHMLDARIAVLRPDVRPRDRRHVGPRDGGFSG